MLGKSLTGKQWLSLVILTFGVSLTTLSTSSANTANTHRNSTLGFAAVLAAATTSGFSGVYFEKILKNSSSSLWVRNLQMGVSSILSGLFGIYLSGELPLVMEHGFFAGYNWIVWMVILLQAVGGLIVAVVVKYADNILKGFASSFSMITSCLLSYFFFDFQPNYKFVLGALFVNVSMIMYSNGGIVKKPSLSENKQSTVEDNSLSTDSYSNSNVLSGESKDAATGGYDV